MIKILLIEDIQQYLEIQRSTLRRSNFEVLVAQNASEAIRVARRERPRLVVLDLEMVERSGGNLIDLVQSEPALQNVPVLLISARQEAQQVARERGFAAALQKPVEPQQLLGVITKLLNLGRRVELRALVVITAIQEAGTEKRVGHSVDLSESGMLAEFRRPLSVGSAVEVRFFLPGEPEGFTIGAEVARCSESGGDAYDVGFRFTEVPRSEAERLKRFLARSEAKSRATLVGAAR